ncbi:MAG: hypothetical protein GKS06_11485 [Acidobacteria bacterium]|nr:hypothetical protein [Acidobacteriota bacterium]
MNEAFYSALIRQGETNFAGHAASLMLERDAALEERFAPGAHGRWQDNQIQRLRELAAALDAQAPTVFGAQTRWNAHAFQVRGLRPDDLAVALDALEEILRDSLPAKPAEILEPYFGAARDALGAGAAPIRSALDPDNDEHRPVLKYMSLALEGRQDDAMEFVEEIAAERGPERAYVEILIPAQREIGRMWFLDEASVADEHVVTQTTARASALLARQMEKQDPTGKTIIVAAVETNAHDLGARFVADFFRTRGWRTVFLGADTPADAVAEAVVSHNADVVALSASIVTQLNRVALTISALRSSERSDVKVIVGGPGFTDAPEAWNVFGADGYALTPQDAVDQANGLTSA